MAQSLSKVLLHIVFSTKNRQKTISKYLRAKLHAYLAGVCRAKGSEAYRVGGTDDHVHIACTLPRTLTMAKLVEEIKKPSSSWMKQQEGGIALFSWQAGYGIFSLGQSQLPALLRYIDNQEEHHRTKSFDLYGQKFSFERQTCLLSKTLWEQNFSLSVARGDNIGLHGVVDFIRRNAGRHGAFEKGSGAAVAAVAAGAQDDGALQALGTVVG
jgi:putative transposase